MLHDVILAGLATASVLLHGCGQPAPAPSGSFDWIRTIANGPTGQQVQLEARTYLIDNQYQLPSGTELRGVGTALDHRTVIKAVGTVYNACAGSRSAPGLVQGRRGLLLGDNTYVGGFHFIGMETKRLDCLYAPVETPGCRNSEGDWSSVPNLTDCGGFTGNDGNGVSNATVEDVTVEPYTTQNLFFMAPNPVGKRVSRNIIARNLRVNGTWADGVNIHGQHSNVVVEYCTVLNSYDDCFAMWSIGTGLDNVTFRNNVARPHPGCNCCYVNFGGLRSAFVDNYGEECGLTPMCGSQLRPEIPPDTAALVTFGSPSSNAPVFGLFGGAWNSSSVSVVRNVTGTCAGTYGCITTCFLQASKEYPQGFPGNLSCPDPTTLPSGEKVSI